MARRGLALNASPGLWQEHEFGLAGKSQTKAASGRELRGQHSDPKPPANITRIQFLDAAHRCSAGTVEVKTVRCLRARHSRSNRREGALNSRPVHPSLAEEGSEGPA